MSQPSPPSPHSTPVLDASASDGGFGTWRWDAREDRLDLEEPWATTMGLGPPPRGRQAWLDAVAAVDREGMRQRWDEVVLDGRPVQWTFALHGDPGRRRLLARARRTERAGHEPGLEGILLDITPPPPGAAAEASEADAQPEASLRQEEALFGRLADALPILVWAARPDGRLDYVNAPLQRYTGQAAAEHWEQAVHGDDVRALRQRWQAALQRGEALVARCRVHRAQDDTWRWHTVHAVPIREADGSVMRWLGALVDDHEWRTLLEANQQLLAAEQRARQAAEDAGRMKDEFLATLGHELRTPLNAITGWTSLLKRGGLSQADQVRAVEVIDRNAQAQRHLIDELLDVSRVISGHVRLDLQPVFLRDVVSHVVEAARPMAEARGLRLEVELAEDSSPVTGDPGRLQQVGAHLLANAVKFTPPGGTVRVTLATGASRVRLAVSDTGIGIPAAFLPFVFDRFRQAESAAARRYGGLGLGLAAVRQIVQMHGGQVDVASEGEGQGATFTVTLPSAVGVTDGAREVVASTDVPEGLPSPLRGQSILVIEDDPDSREMLSVVLENAGGVPVGAATVAEGLRLLGDLQIDVVLSDIGMPGRDGFDLIRALRAFPHPRVRRAPAIAVTAFSRSEDRARILDAGFDAHVTKPVEPAQLLAAIAEVGRKRQGTPPPRLPSDD